MIACFSQGITCSSQGIFTCSFQGMVTCSSQGMTCSPQRSIYSTRAAQGWGSQRGPPRQCPQPVLTSTAQSPRPFVLPSHHLLHERSQLRLLPLVGEICSTKRRSGSRGPLGAPQAPLEPGRGRRKQQQAEPRVSRANAGSTVQMEPQKTRGSLRGGGSAPSPPWGHPVPALPGHPCHPEPPAAGPPQWAGIHKDPQCPAFRIREPLWAPQSPQPLMCPQ